jgi:hypothetical protein
LISPPRATVCSSKATTPELVFGPIEVVYKGLMNLLISLSLHLLLSQISMYRYTLVFEKAYVGS